MAAERTYHQLNNVLPVPEVSGKSTLVPVGLVFRSW